MIQLSSMMHVAMAQRTLLGMRSIDWWTDNDAGNVVCAACGRKGTVSDARYTDDTCPACRDQVAARIEGSSVGIVEGSILPEWGGWNRSLVDPNGRSNIGGIYSDCGTRLPLTNRLVAATVGNLTVRAWHVEGVHRPVLLPSEPISEYVPPADVIRAISNVACVVCNNSVSVRIGSRTFYSDRKACNDWFENGRCKKCDTVARKRMQLGTVYGPSQFAGWRIGWYTFVGVSIRRPEPATAVIPSGVILSKAMELFPRLMKGDRNHHYLDLEVS